jgi:hypothetical protein
VISAKRNVRALRGQNSVHVVTVHFSSVELQATSRQVKQNSAIDVKLNSKTPAITRVARGFALWRSGGDGVRGS